MTKGCERELEIRGVGFRAEVKGKQIHFALGFSHPVVFDAARGRDRRGRQGAAHRGQPAHHGADPALRRPEALGATAVKIRALRPPEPYKGKGIKYAEEHVRRKEGKTGTA